MNDILAAIDVVDENKPILSEPWPVISAWKGAKLAWH